MMRYKIFGCKTNKYYTEKWLNSEFLKDRQGVFIASCIVTEKAKSKWLKFVIDTIQGFADPQERIYLSGCATIRKGEVTQDFFSIYPELEAYRSRIELLAEDPERQGISEAQGNMQKQRLYTRKYVIIQNGCDNHCTFCLTIQARGSHVSRSAEHIISEIRAFEQTGGKEVVLTGTNIGAWGCGNTKRHEESKLPELLRTILSQTSIERIRISSLGVEYLKGDLLRIFADPRIYAHFHLSIQSGSERVLRLMNRNYDRATLEDRLSALSSISREDGLPISIGADFIVGFPQEEDSDFEDTLRIIREYGIAKVHAFPFSTHAKHDSIPAAKLSGQVKDHIKKSRIDEIGRVSQLIRDGFLQEHHGKLLNLLVEKSEGGRFSGWSQNYIHLDEKNFNPIPGQVIAVGSIIIGTYSSSGVTSESDRAEYG